MYACSGKQIERRLVLSTVERFYANRECCEIPVSGCFNKNCLSLSPSLMTQVGHIAYHSMRLDETNTMTSRPRLYLDSVKSY